jgi:hypothetical protein
LRRTNGVPRTCDLEMMTIREILIVSVPILPARKVTTRA